MKVLGADRATAETTDVVVMKWLIIGSDIHDVHIADRLLGKKIFASLASMT